MSKPLHRHRYRRGVHFADRFARLPLRANYDIRTIQQLLGHSDLRTTMIYTHAVKSRTLKDMSSSLDFRPEELRQLETFSSIA